MRLFHSPHECLWAEDLLKLHTKLLVQIDVREFDCYNPEINVRFPVFLVYRMLDRFELEQFKIHASVLAGKIEVDQS